MKTKNTIPVYNQSSEAVGGVFIARLSSADNYDDLGIHRDDFYIFCVLISGTVVMTCDMVDVEMQAPGVLIVKPFQVHSIKRYTKDGSGYFISVAPFLIPTHCADVFHNLKITAQSHNIQTADKEELLDTVNLLHRSFRNVTANKTQVVNGLFNALVYRFAGLYGSAPKLLPELKNQAGLICSAFKKLIPEHSFLETPSFFAKLLHISTSHLNDCVSAETGKPVTYWLQNAMVVEAQRQLYYTELDVKEIAFNLGFEDPAYFSRLFKKITNDTPLGFRKKFRE